MYESLYPDSLEKYLSRLNVLGVTIGKDPTLMKEQSLKGFLRTSNGQKQFPPVIIATPGSLFSCLSKSGKQSSMLTELLTYNLERVIVDEADLLMGDGSTSGLPLFLIRILRQRENSNKQHALLLSDNRICEKQMDEQSSRTGFIFSGATMPQKSVVMAWIDRYLGACRLLRSSGFHSIVQSVFENQNFVAITPVHVHPASLSPLSFWKHSSEPQYDENTFKKLAEERSLEESKYEERIFNHKMLLLKNVVERLVENQQDSCHILVFVNSGARVSLVFDRIKNPNPLETYYQQDVFCSFETATLHAGVDPVERSRIIERLNSPEHMSRRLVICTDYAGRGLDIPAVGNIINFDFPMSASDYIHRVGRAGRMGKRGVVYSFHVIGKEDMIVDAVKRVFGASGCAVDSAESVFSNKRSLRTRSRRTEQKE